MALLFALDRAGAVEDIHAATEAYDIVILDRYVASNAAYNAARLEQGAGGEMVRWVVDLEFGRFDMPVPDRHVLLGVSPEVAMQRAASRADQDAARARDAYERDDAGWRCVDGVVTPWPTGPVRWSWTPPPRASAWRTCSMWCSASSASANEAGL